MNLRKTIGVLFIIAFLFPQASFAQVADPAETIRQLTIQVLTLQIQMLTQQLNELMIKEASQLAINPVPGSTGSGPTESENELSPENRFKIKVFQLDTADTQIVESLGGNVELGKTVRIAVERPTSQVPVYLISGNKTSGLVSGNPTAKISFVTDYPGGVSVFGSSGLTGWSYKVSEGLVLESNGVNRNNITFVADQAGIWHFTFSVSGTSISQTLTLTVQ